MRTKEIGKAVLQRLGASRSVLITITAALVLGLLIGTVSALNMGENELSALSENMGRVFSAYSLQSVDKHEVFKIALYNNFKSLLLLWVSGLSLFLAPFAFLRFGIKGFKLGFAIAFLTKAYKWKGIFFSFISMFPQNFIALPLLLLYGVYLIRRTGEMYLLKNKSDSKFVKKRLYLADLRYITVMSMLLVLCSVLEAYFVPVLARPICSAMI